MDESFIGGGILFGVICAIVAHSRGRSGIGWFFVGFVIQCFGLILLLMIPDLKLEAQRESRRSLETRKLKEQLKKERQVSDERHIAQRARLDAHDRALRLDTSAEDQRLIEQGMAPPPLSAPGAASPQVPWFFASGGERQGPIPESELRQRLRSQDIEPDTFVWRQGMDNWQAAHDVDELLDDIPT